MGLQNLFSFDIVRMPILGSFLLGLGVLASSFILLSIPLQQPFVTIPSSSKDFERSFEFGLPLKTECQSFVEALGESQILFSRDPPRPGGDKVGSRLMVRLSESGQVLRVEPPCRIDLRFSETGILEFSQDPSMFAVELLNKDNTTYEAVLTYKDPVNGSIKRSSWDVLPQEAPIQSTQQLPLGSHFRILSEGRWCGQDLFMESYGNGESIQRIEVGMPNLQNIIDLKVGEFIVFRNNRWEKLEKRLTESEEPIARIQRFRLNGLELEGWEKDSYIRLLLPLSAQGPMKTRGEELFSQLRIRSEKQISCTLDKQCLILRLGDWVLKTEQRWKILRKKEEKDAFLDGLIKGELFVLDRIEAKGAIKSISGHYFSTNRAQKAAIDYAVTANRAGSNRISSVKNNEPASTKARGRG